MTRSFSFVIPDAHASISGGNLYNLGLLSALRAAGADVRIADRALADSASFRFVDSLFLDDVPRLSPCHLLAHYLPSLVSGEGPSSSERAALAAADGFLVPSAFMARTLSRFSERPSVVVSPAVEVKDLPRGPALAVARAVMVANLVPGKGVLAFLEALPSEMRWELCVIGGLDRDPAYAAACRARRADVRFLGELSHEATLAEIARSDLLVSASRMESFGLALAEARALGVPIVARAGGNAFAHVAASAGGRLVATDGELAAECVHLASDPAELARRRAAALAARPPARTWADAAREFLAAFSD